MYRFLSDDIATYTVLFKGLDTLLIHCFILDVGGSQINGRCRGLTASVHGAHALLTELQQRPHILGHPHIS